MTTRTMCPWICKMFALPPPDYGGLPLKIIWALLDIMTIAVLVSGSICGWRRAGDMSAPL